MYININDTTYYVTQSGDGPPVLLLHGFTGAHSTWSDFMSSHPSLHCVAIDMPGHGRTEGDLDFTMESVCKDIATLLDYLQLDEVHLLGYSMGGRTALSFAMIFPERVASLTLESASPGLGTVQEQLARQTKDESLAEQIEAKGVEAFVDYWETLPMFSTQQDLPYNTQHVIRKERVQHSAKGLAASLRGMGTGIQPSWWDRLSTFEQPVLLITGEKDEKFTSIAKKMENQFQNARHVEIKQAGHAIHVEQTRFFGKIVDDFILGMEPGESA
ncbi:2-succinyl-6-hydroxy-2,4-cyclohexadiene-1-carboxylate synthase [Pontibacillus salicampi]|uniref:Putative 2-succinyl-6-hydroxy-2,4-cyclohexadiene-1-carboxylate synthase n=1 Tax=Pontibacillus salicampi TaxID=1449801 RepID=A0ABV6LNE6_9BACI